ncbi:MAG: translocation/assembly module TamB domain-containing protein [Alistipes indistinctus]
MQKIEVRLQGEVTSPHYTMNQLGDSRFSGKYEVSGGFVRYKPPVISEKSFDIVAGSYVEWSGEMLDPAFNLAAVDKVRTNVTSDGSDSGRPVTFDIQHQRFVILLRRSGCLRSTFRLPKT